MISFWKPTHTYILDGLTNDDQSQALNKSGEKMGLYNFENFISRLKIHDELLFVGKN